jgi:hypothetical protein
MLDKKEKKIYKYATGDTVPDGAIYLGTIQQNEIYTNISNTGDESKAFWKKCYFVWHYFLVKV